ncbi:MAG: hypothetical protein K0R51_283 [Cytophagaceae bacterium]|jgi:hypothetical protein|nr:hypothetical protein [Cytophagaceae bacterium]
MQKILGLLLLTTFSFSFLATAQDSLKTKAFVLNVQGYPDSTAFEHDFTTDRVKGLWIKNYALEEADTSVRYYLIERKGNAIIEKVPGSKNAFYITPIGKKLKRMKNPIIEIQVLLVISKDNLYFPIKKSSDLRLLDENRKVIEENVTWKNYNALKKRKGKLWQGSLFYNVRIE